MIFNISKKNEKKLVLDFSVFLSGFLALDKVSEGGCPGWGGGGERREIQFCNTTETEKYMFTVGNDHVLQIPCIKNPI